MNIIYTPDHYDTPFIFELDEEEATLLACGLAHLARDYPQHPKANETAQLAFQLARVLYSETIEFLDWRN